MAKIYCYSLPSLLLGSVYDSIAAYLENNGLKEHVKGITSDVFKGIADELVCDEEFIKGTYCVTIMRGSETVTSYMFYGTPGIQALGMDADLDDLEIDYDEWDELSATISHENKDVLTMPRLSESKFIVNMAIYDLFELHNELDN